MGHGVDGAAHALHIECLDRTPAGGRCIGQALGGDGLQPHDQHGRDIGVGGIAEQHMIVLGQVVAKLAAAIGDAHGNSAFDRFADAPNDGVDVVHGGDDGHVVANAEATVFSWVGKNRICHALSPRPRRLSRL